MQLIHLNTTSYQAKEGTLVVLTKKTRAKRDMIHMAGMMEDTVVPVNGSETPLSQYVHILPLPCNCINRLTRIYVS